MVRFRITILASSGNYCVNGSSIIVLIIWNYVLPISEGADLYSIVLFELPDIFPGGTY